MDIKSSGVKRFSFFFFDSFLLVFDFIREREKRLGEQERERDARTAINPLRYNVIKMTFYIYALCIRRERASARARGI